MTARATLPAPSAGLRQRALRIHRVLCRHYGAPFPLSAPRDPVHALVSTLLSHRTRNQQTGEAIRALRERFPTWEEVRDAPVAEVEATISAATWPEQKAPRIQAALAHIAARQGSIDLDFLAEMTPAKAQAWLEEIPGVGPKTSAAVLLMSRLRLPAMPVDSHHHRVAARLGLLPAGMGPGPAHAWLLSLLPPEWGVQELHDDHRALMYHGQRCCHWRAPACGRCPLAVECPSRGITVGYPRFGLVEASGEEDEE